MYNVTSLDNNGDIGNTIRFRTMHNTDTVEITGILVSVGDYRMAEVFSDIALYNVGVAQGAVANGLTAEDYTGEKSLAFTYIIIEGDGGVRTAYALEWLNSDGYVVVTSTQSIDIRLKNVTQGDVASVLEAIMSLQISATVVT